MSRSRRQPLVVRGLRARVPAVPVSVEQALHRRASTRGGWDRWTPETTNGLSLRLESVHSDTYRAMVVVLPEDRLI